MEEQTILTPEKLQYVLNEYKDLLLAELPGQIERLILFGSYARGDARAESDVDVMVIVNWPQTRLPNGFYPTYYNDPRWRKIIDLATDMMLKYTIVISPKVFSLERFEDGGEPLTREVKKEGVDLWQKNQILSTPGSPERMKD
ncbi:MAG: nucleotidyltransferase domain-containing protein [Anaerolineae bacterium]|nr:nucleotidyltransferase domain-containing protein [Anaerolineae bacterium]